MDGKLFASLVGAIPTKFWGQNAKKYALVRDGVVVSCPLWDAEEFPEWKPSEPGELIEAGPEVSPGFLYDGKTFTDPNYVEKQLISVEDAKEKRIAEIDAAFSRYADRLSVSDADKATAKADGLAAIEAVKASRTREEAKQICDSFCSKLA